MAFSRKAIGAARKHAPKASKAQPLGTQNVLPPSTTTTAAELKAFHDGAGKLQDFGFIRYWWDTEGDRSGIAQKVLKKLRPIVDADDPDAETAAKSDLLVPADAQADYWDPKLLMERFDAKLPSHEKHAFIQVTLRFPDAINLHGPWEEARAFAMDYFVLARRLAVLLVLHAPNLAGSSNPIHTHLIVPVRRVVRFGWGEVDRELPGDRGQRACFEAWQAFREEWAVRCRSADEIG